MLSASCRELPEFWRATFVRIALTITELDPGGAEQCLVQLAIYLQSRGHEVRVFALGPTPSSTLGESTNRQSLTNLLSQHGIPWQTGNASGLRSLPSVVKWLRSELHRMSPDLIQSMLFHANVVTALANRKLNVPHFGGARVSQPSSWRRIMQRWATKRMIKLICVSQTVAAKCIEQEGIASSKVCVIPNGVSLQRLAVTALAGTNRSDSNDTLSSIPTEAPVLLFVGRLTPQKGILPLVQKVDQLLENLPQHHLVILGDGPEREKVQASVAQSNTGGRVHVLGWRSDAIDWIRRSQILLLPSIYEGMPNVVMEAMGCGKPVVVFAVEGIDELLPEDPQQVVTGFDLPVFIERVKDLAQDQNRCTDWGTKNLERIVQHFRIEDQLAKYEQLYQQHVSNNRGSNQ